jgi:hypothetical protein
MKRSHIFLFTIILLAAGCATTAPKPSPPVQPPAEQEGTMLDIDFSDLENRIQYLEKLLEVKDLSERDAKAVSALLQSYRLLKEMAHSPVTGEDCSVLTKSLFRSMSLVESRYVEEIRKASSDENSYADYIKRRDEIVNLYSKKDYKGVIKLALALQTRFPGGLTPRIGILFAASLAEDGMLQEAVEIGSEVAREIEGSLDGVKLRGEIARWQLALGRPARAAKTLEGISRAENEKTELVDELSRQIQQAPKAEDQSFRSVFHPPEGAEQLEMSPPMAALQRKVDELAQDHDFAQARRLLLEEKAKREEGPDTALIDRAIMNVDEAEGAYEEKMKAREAYGKETYETALRLFENEDYKGAITALQTLENTQGLDTATADLKGRATENLINHERNRAAEIFLEAKKTKDPKKKRELLETARNILKTLVDDYPQSPMKPKLISHIKIVESEIKKLP